MSTETYTGRLSDFREVALPQEPRLWVEPLFPANGPNGPLATRQIPITLEPGGLFSVQLVPSTETVPPARYRLRAEWTTYSGFPRAGSTEWEFYAQPGGGPITGDYLPPNAIIIALGKPLDVAANVVWIDLNDQTAAGAQVYARPIGG